MKEAHCSGTWRAGFSYPAPSMHSDPEENVKLERKMRAGINKLEDTKNRGINNKTQSWFFVSTNKKDQALANIIKKKKRAQMKSEMRK